MTGEEQQKYVDLMSEIKNRIDFLTSFRANLPSPVLAELVAVQIRKAIEGVVFSSLISNVETYSEIYRDFAEHWKIGRICERIKKGNPDYLPIPVRERQVSAQEFELDHLSGPEYFTEADLLAMYQACSEIIHRPNPYKVASHSPAMFLQNAPAFTKKMIATLNSHQVHPFNDREIYLVHMFEPGRPGPTIYPFAAFPEPGVQAADRDAG